MSALGVPPFPLGFGAAVLLMALFFVLAMGQALHASRLVCWRVRPRSLAVYEALLVAHLVLGFCVARAASRGFPPGSVALLWPAGLVVGTALISVGSVVCARAGRARMLPELACIALTLPVCAGPASGWAGTVLVLDAVVMAGRVAAALVRDGRLRREGPERDAMAEAVRLLPEGVLCIADDDGRVLFANDAMRSCLAGLGLPADLADLSGVWDALEKRARGREGDGAAVGEGLRLEVAPGDSRLFVRSESELRAGVDPDAATELAAVADAFGLMGVKVRLEGALPADREVALLFVRVVRECATNAVRHGRARAIDVCMGEGVAEGGVRCATLLVTNDGATCAGVLRPGGGLTGMRAAAEAVGASFDACAGPPFAVRVCAPLSVGRPAEAAAPQNEAG